MVGIITKFSYLTIGVFCEEETQLFGDDRFSKNTLIYLKSYFVLMAGNRLKNHHRKVKINQFLKICPHYQQLLLLCV